MYRFARTLVVTLLTLEARWLLRRHRPTIIAITGSVGKTSLKDAVYTVLKNHTTARKSEKSYNSELGIPLTVLGLPNAWNNPLGWLKNLIDGALTVLFTSNYPKVLVIEAGVDRPGDMTRLTAWLRPDIAVITGLPDVPAHVEFFSSPEAVCREKLALGEAVKDNGVLIYNHDDIKLQEYAQTSRHRTVGYGREIPTDVTASADRTEYENDGTPAGFACTVTHGEVSAHIPVRGVIGAQLSYTVAGAIAVALESGMTFTDAAATVSKLTPPPGRMRIIPGIKNTTIIDDTYNSSPVAALAALTALREVSSRGRKIAVLGDMLELGKFSPAEHERVGVVAATSCDVLVTVGIRSQKTAEGAIEHGLSEKTILQYEEAGKAGRELQNYIQPGDVLLIKGSQGIRMERIVEELMHEPDRAKELLVRQNAEWLDR
jgi:UDP-N-acetylmuramoyl-tripeptide--D-alanyl-D-alanine ligase